MSSIFSTILQVIIGFLLMVIVLAKPYLGLALVVASQPITEILPSIPILTSVVPIIGGVTILGFLIKARNEHIRFAFRFSSIHLISLLLVLWIFVSNPEAAMLASGRNWVFTYLQLLILLWLSGFLLNSPKKHQGLMQLVSLTALVSAFIAMRQGGFLTEIDPLIRAEGLAEGANTATRYFIIAFIFMSYLRTVRQPALIRLFFTIGMIVSFLGVFYTASRTGILLLLLAIVLLFIFQTKFKLRVQIGVISSIALLILVIFSNSIFGFIQGIFPSISQGTDTVGLRYALWDAGIQMWQDHPIAGVGIGMFAPTLHLYPNPAYTFYFSRGLVAHNMYISMLAETGLIGIILFMATIFAAIGNFWKSRKFLDDKFRSIQNTWVIVFLIMLAGGITKTDQVDKFLWLTMGVSVFFNNYLYFLRKKVPQTDEKKLEKDPAFQSGTVR